MAKKFNKNLFERVCAVLRPIVAWEGSCEDDNLVSVLNGIGKRYADGARMLKRDAEALAQGVARCVEMDSKFAVA